MIAPSSLAQSCFIHLTNERSEYAGSSKSNSHKLKMLTSYAYAFSPSNIISDSPIIYIYIPLIPHVYHHIISHLVPPRYTNQSSGQNHLERIVGIWHCKKRRHILRTQSYCHIPWFFTEWKWRAMQFQLILCDFRNEISVLHLFGAECGEECGVKSR